MKWTGTVLAAIAALHLMAGAAQGQETRFLRAEEFDRTWLRSGTYVQVSFYREGKRLASTKGHVSAVRERSFTVANANQATSIPFRDVGILIVGRSRPDIFVFRDRPIFAGAGLDS